MTYTRLAGCVLSTLLLGGCGLIGSSSGDDEFVVGGGNPSAGDADTNDANQTPASADSSGEPDADNPYASTYLDGLLNQMPNVSASEKSKIADELVRRGPENLPLIQGFYEGVKRNEPETATQLEFVILMLKNDAGESESIESDDPQTGGGESEVAQPEGSDGPDLDNPNNVLGDYGYDEDARLVGGEGDFDPAEVDRFVLDRLRKAQDAHLEGDHALAIKICEALLLLHAESSHARSIQQLMLDARTGTQSERLVAGTLRATQPIVRFDADRKGWLEQPLKLVLTLHNRSNRTILLDLGDGGDASSSLLRLQREITEQDMLNQTLSLAGSANMRIKGEPVELTPGGAPVSVEVEIEDVRDISPNQGAFNGISKLVISGALRPARLEVQSKDDPDKWERLFRPIALRSIEVMVMPPEFPIDQVQLTPASWVRTALKEQNYNGLFLASAVIPQESYAEVFDILLASDIHNTGLLEKRSRLDLVERLSKQRFEGDADAALRWWRRNRPSYMR